MASPETSISVVIVLDPAGVVAATLAHMESGCLSKIVSYNENLFDRDRILYKYDTYVYVQLLYVPCLWSLDPAWLVYVTAKILSRYSYYLCTSIMCAQNVNFS